METPSPPTLSAQPNPSTPQTATSSLSLTPSPVAPKRLPSPLQSASKKPRLAWRQGEEEDGDSDPDLLNGWWIY